MPNYLQQAAPGLWDPSMMGQSSAGTQNYWGNQDFSNAQPYGMMFDGASGLPQDFMSLLGLQPGTTMPNVGGNSGLSPGTAPASGDNWLSSLLSGTMGGNSGIDPAYQGDTGNWMEMLLGGGGPGFGGDRGVAPEFQPNQATGLPNVGGDAGLSPDYGSTGQPAYGTTVDDTIAGQAQRVRDLAEQQAGVVGGAYTDYGDRMAETYEQAYDPLLSATTEARNALMAANQRATGTRVTGFQESGDLYRTAGQDITAATSAMTEPWRTTGARAMEDLYGLTGQDVAATGDFATSPGYQFRLDEGMNAILQNRAAKGGVRSGATDRAITEYGQGLAAGEYGDWWNRMFQQKGQKMGGYGEMAGLGADLAKTTAVLNQDTGKWSTEGQSEGILGGSEAQATGYETTGNIQSEMGQQYANYLSDMIMGGRSAQAESGLQGTLAGSDILLGGAGQESNLLLSQALAQAQQGSGSGSTFDWASLIAQLLGSFA